MWREDREGEWVSGVEREGGGGVGVSDRDREVR
jgi:hypothetical protein